MLVMDLKINKLLKRENSFIFSFGGIRVGGILLNLQNIQLMGNQPLKNSIWDQSINQFTQFVERDVNQSSEILQEGVQPAEFFQHESSNFRANYCWPDCEYNGMELDQEKVGDADLYSSEEKNQQEEKYSEALEIQHYLQKNQFVRRNSKTKKIHKSEKKPKKLRQAQQNHVESIEEPSQGLLELEKQQQQEEEMRNQNNCKTYHKIVKNYLIRNNKAKEILHYEKDYHTRYYFLIALKIISVHFPFDDFVSFYKNSLVQDQIESQNCKIIKRKEERLKSEKSLKELELSGKMDSKSFRELECKIQKITKQIKHTEQVMHEISKFSVESCEAFFKGEAYTALEILYKKDDEKMKKSYYFRPAYEKLRKIFQQIGAKAQ